MKTTLTKKLLTLILAIAITLSLAPALASTANAAAAPLTATPTSSTVLVNGKIVAFDAYSISGNNYFKLRDIAYTLSGTVKQFAVGWDKANNAISLTSGRRYAEVGGEMAGKGTGTKTPNPTTSKIYLNEREIKLTAYNIGGNNYFKLRDIGKSLNFGVDWDAAKRTIAIDTNRRYYDESGNTSYSASYYGAAQGSAKFLAGKSIIVSIFMSPGNQNWDSAGISKNAENLRKAAKFLVSEGKRYSKDVELICDFETNADLKYDMKYNGKLPSLDDEYTGQESADDAASGVDQDEELNTKVSQDVDDFIESNIPYLALADKYGTDSIAYIVFVNKGEGSCHARQYSIGSPEERYHEKCYMNGRTAQYPSVLAHETLHLFSTHDLYGKNLPFGITDELVKYARETYPDEIMLPKKITGDVSYDMECTEEISPISAYWLGWQNDIPELTQFPDLKRDIPAAVVNRRELMNGAVTWVYSYGTYTGNFVNGNRSGYGVLEFNDGNKYEGNWVDNEMSGKGTLTQKSGNVYSGNFANGEFSGQGTYTWTDGREYTGNFANGNFHGQGKMKFSNGDVYDGNWVNGKISGHGIMTMANGNVYDGNWENSKISGQGTYKYANGDVYTGGFADGIRSGQGTFKSANGDEYTGGFSGGHLSGQGKYTWASGNVYNGNWDNDKMNGKGTFTWANGNEYIGNWENGTRTGYGVLTMANGQVQAGMWKNDKFLG